MLCLAIVFATGLYLLLYYRIGAPYESVARMTDQVWAGRWIRGLHRYASDAAIVLVLLHAFRMFAQGRSWGPRVLAWLSGIVLLGIVLVSGWTGYVMVWDVQAQALAVEGARMLDALPLFADPVGRAFVGPERPPGAFFFLNLFLHIALPVGMGLVLWVHVSRVARPTLMPPRRLAVALTGGLLALAILWPVPMAAPADLLRLPGEVPLDLFYAVWLPVTRLLPPWAGLALLATAALAPAAIPLWTRPRGDRRPPPSVVDERLCTGCVQCSLDCPYEAIAMLERTDGRADLVARVDPALCVSCGICAGSCAPMGVGPPGRTGRDQLADLRAWLGEQAEIDDVAIVVCDRGPGAAGSGAAIEGAPALRVPCIGGVHSSVVERLLGRGARGVLLLACPPRDCWNREGPKWAGERLFHDREAELHERVDKRRVRLAHAGAGEAQRVRAEVRAFRAAIAELDQPAGVEGLGEARECEPAAPREVIRR